MSDLITEMRKMKKNIGTIHLHIVEDTKQDCIDQVITDFCYRWFASKEDIMYAATHYRMEKFQMKCDQNNCRLCKL